MGQVKGSFTVNVTPGASQNPVLIVPDSGALPDEQEGVAVNQKIATVSGGVAPYTYKFDGQPDGISFDEKDNGDGTFDILAVGTPSAGDAAKSPYTINVTVNDSATPSASARRSLNVSA